MSEIPTIHQDDSKKKKRNFWLGLASVTFLLIGICWVLYWLLVGRFYVYTEDAYVNGNTVMLTPQVNAGVAAIYADNTDFVEEGQLIIQLDSSDYEIAFHAKKAALEETVRRVASLFEDVMQKEAEVRLRSAELNQRKLNLDNRLPLNDTGALAKEEFEQAQTNVMVSEAALDLAKRQLAAAQLQVAHTTVETHPLVKEAVSSVREAYLNLIRCSLKAPTTGYVAKRIAQVGDQVQEGTTLLWIVPLNEVWMEANYKETQLKDVRQGQPVTFTADLYGKNVKYHGKVIGFSAGTGSAFALLPPENASGNWIKIVQRLPVRIQVDPKELKEHPLMIGLSLRVKVDIHDKEGSPMQQVPVERTAYATSLYERQCQEMEKLEALIGKLIEQNKTLESD